MSSGAMPADQGGNVASLLQAAPSPAPAGVVDNLTCKWAHCGERCSTPELLYEHVCDKHVGRKSTNNLNLTCAWGACRTNTVKRDHITSHIRVHVPLKPHKCDLCHKSFKRPQDLKKHVKTHADESVLLKSPEPAPHSRVPVANGYHQPGHDQKQGGYYQGSSGVPSSGKYGYAPPSNHAQYVGNGVQAQQHYGSVYYNVPQAVGYDMGESRKRGHDELNMFFGEAKRRHIDSGSYMDVGSRFGPSLQTMGVPIPIFADHGYTNNAFAAGAAMDGQHGPSVAYQPMAAAPHTFAHYNTMAFSEMKTKSDLMSIDQFLEQLQHTVYEHSNQMADGGMPTAHDAMHSDVSVGSRDSPSTFESTPAMTPDSYPPSQSPASSHDGLSPSTRPAGGIRYPQLPSFSSLADTSTGSYPPTSGIPTSSLGTNLDDFDGRTYYSGGHLQRAARASPPAKRASPPPASEDAKLKGIKREEGSPAGSQLRPNLPGIASITRPNSDHLSDAETGTGSDGSDVADERHEAWVNNMRVIEALRAMVKERLTKGDYTDADEDEREGATTPKASAHAARDADGDTSMAEDHTPPPRITYPTLRAVHA